MNQSGVSPVPRQPPHAKTSRQFERFMGRLHLQCAALFAAVALAVVSCSKKQEPPAGADSEKPGEPAPGPPPQFVTAVAENKPAENVTGVVDAFLTQQLQIFIQQKQRLPEDFAELARTRLDSVPRPPQGKKWVIDKSTRQVKAVAEQ